MATFNTRKSEASESLLSLLLAVTRTQSDLLHFSGVHENLTERILDGEARFGRQGRIKGVPGGRDRGGWRGWNVECHTMAVTGAEPRGAKTQMFAPPGPGAFEKLNEETGSVNEDKRQPWSDTEDLAA